MFLHCSFNRWFGMIQSHPNTPQTPFRHLSYISRHPKIYLCWRCEVHCQEFLTAQPQLGKAVIAYDLISNCYSINTVLATSMINQTPSRNPPDTIRHNAITSVFSLSVASTRLFGTQSNLFGCFLRSPVYVLCMSYAPRWLDSVWRVSRWCQIGPGYCQDCINGITIDKNHFV